MKITNGHCHKTFEINEAGKTHWLNVSFNFDLEEGEDEIAAAVAVVKKVNTVFKKTHPKQNIKKPNIKVTNGSIRTALNELP